MNPNQAEDKAWQSVLSRLPSTLDIEQSARTLGALKRKREVKSADDLLRLILVYCVCGMSLRVTAAWAQCHNLATLSDVATLKRIRKALPWLQHIFSALVYERVAYWRKSSCNYHLSLIDASCVKAAGKSGATWRVHSRYSLSEGIFTDLVVSDVHGCEHVERFAWNKDDVVIADRAYATAKQVHQLSSIKTKFIFRIGVKRCPLSHADGSKFDLIGAARRTPLDRPAVHTVYVANNHKRSGTFVQVRLIILRYGDGATQRAAKKVYHKGQKNQRKPTPIAFEMARYLCLITTLPECHFDLDLVLGLYRFRWQIELAFKRWKSLVRLAEVRAKEAVLVQCCLYAGLITALLSENLAKEIEQELYQEDTNHSPPSSWRLIALVVKHFRSATVGALTLPTLILAAPGYGRVMREPPRLRRLQLFRFNLACFSDLLS